MDNLVANGGERRLFDSNCICEGTLTSSQYSTMMGGCSVRDPEKPGTCDHCVAVRKIENTASLSCNQFGLVNAGRGWSMSDMSAHHWAQTKS